MKIWHKLIELILNEQYDETFLNNLLSVKDNLKGFIIEYKKIGVINLKQYNILLKYLFFLLPWMSSTIRIFWIDSFINDYLIRYKHHDHILQLNYIQHIITSNTDDHQIFLLKLLQQDISLYHHHTLLKLLEFYITHHLHHFLQYINNLIINHEFLYLLVYLSSINIKLSHEIFHYQKIYQYILNIIHKGLTIDQINHDEMEFIDIIHDIDDINYKVFLKKSKKKKKNYHIIWCLIIIQNIITSYNDHKDSLEYKQIEYEICQQLIPSLMSYIYHFYLQHRNQPNKLKCIQIAIYIRCFILILQALYKNNEISMIQYLETLYNTKLQLVIEPFIKFLHLHHSILYTKEKMQNLEIHGKSISHIDDKKQDIKLSTIKDHTTTDSVFTTILHTNKKDYAKFIDMMIDDYHIVHDQMIDNLLKQTISSTATINLFSFNGWLHQLDEKNYHFNDLITLITFLHYQNFYKDQNIHILQQKLGTLKNNTLNVYNNHDNNDVMNEKKKKKKKLRRRRGGKKKKKKKKK